eukprot:evm.model.NODE_9458_length_12454_cov_18.506584.5
MPSPRHSKTAAAVSSHQANKRRRQAPAAPSAAGGPTALASTFPASSSVPRAAAPSSFSSSSSTASSAPATRRTAPSFEATMLSSTAATRRPSTTTASSTASASSSSSSSSASTPAARRAPATGYIDLTSELSDEDELEEENGDGEVEFMGITPGTRQPIRSSDTLLRGLFPPPPVRHRAGGGIGGGGGSAAGRSSLPHDMAFSEGLAPLFSHANNLIRLILSHRPMPVANRGATNAQIARLPTHTLPRTTSSKISKGKGKGKKRKAPGDVPVPTNAKSEGADGEAIAAGRGGAGASSSSSSGCAAAVASRDNPHLKMPAGSSVAAAAEGGLGACTICMEDYKGGEKLCTLPCSHVYHFKCCKKWLKTNNICCICRTSIDGGSP